MEIRRWEWLERGWRGRKLVPGAEWWGLEGLGWGRWVRTAQRGAVSEGREGERAPAQPPGAAERRGRREILSANRKEPRAQEPEWWGSWKGPPPCLPSPRRALGGAGRCRSPPRSRAVGCQRPSCAAVRLREVLGEPGSLSERGPVRRRRAAAPAVLPQGRPCLTPAPRAVRLLDHWRISASTRPRLEPMLKPGLYSHRLPPACALCRWRNPAPVRPGEAQGWRVPRPGWRRAPAGERDPAVPPLEPRRCGGGGAASLPRTWTESPTLLEQEWRLLAMQVVIVTVVAGV